MSDLLSASEAGGYARLVQPVVDQAAQRRRALGSLGLPLLVLGNLTFWLGNAFIDLRLHGFFVGLGIDFSRFWAAARLLAVDPAAAYRLPALAGAMRPLARYTALGASGVRLGPVPYPPIFLAAFRLFTIGPAPFGFLLWTGLNLTLAGFVVYDLARQFRGASAIWVAAALLLAYPLMLQFYVGQVVALLVFSLWLAYGAFRRGDDGRAGIWTGLLILKPQYLPCLLLVLLLKRRWRALLGAATGGVAVLLTSLFVGGVSGVLAYIRMLLTVYPRFNGNVGIDPGSMIGWRSLAHVVVPRASPSSGIALTVVLSLLTLLCLPLVWRGRWDGASPRFSRQFLATLVVTLLIAYHSQPTGAALLLIPAADMLAHGEGSRAVRQLLLAGLWLIPLVGLISAVTTGDLELVPLVMAVMLVALLVLLVVGLARGTGAPGVRRSTAGESVLPAHTGWNASQV